VTKREQTPRTRPVRDAYDSYERAYDPRYSDRQVRGQHGLARHFPGPKEEETAAQLAELTPLDIGFETRTTPVATKRPGCSPRCVLFTTTS